MVVENEISVIKLLGIFIENINSLAGNVNQVIIKIVLKLVV